MRSDKEIRIMAQIDITNLTDAEFDRHLVMQDALRKKIKSPMSRGFGVATRGSKFKGTF
jgi:hypothetical protein